MQLCCAPGRQHGKEYPRRFWLSGLKRHAEGRRRVDTLGPLQGLMHLAWEQKEDGRLESPVRPVSGWQKQFSHRNDSWAIGERGLRPRRARSKGSQLSTRPSARAPLPWEWSQPRKAAERGPGVSHRGGRSLWGTSYQLQGRWSNRLLSREARKPGPQDRVRAHYANALDVWPIQGYSYTRHWRKSLIRALCLKSWSPQASLSKASSRWISSECFYQ